MTSPANLDPFELFRQLVNKLESGVNSLAGERMSSEQVARKLGQLSQVSGSIHKTIQKALDTSFNALRLPSRQDIVDLTDAVRKLQDKIDLLTPMAVREPVESRPPRTRKAAPAAPVPPPQAAKPPPKKSSRKKR